MGYQLDLLDDLRRFDVPVIEIAGWQTRGKETLDPHVGVNHHTAGAAHGAAPSLGICINGRSDLAGPLCNVLLGRDLVARLIAAGRSNNAGRGGWKGYSGNSNTLGLEVEHVGTLAEDVPHELIEMSCRIQAAFAWQRYDAEHVCQHFEWTDRKVDFVEAAVPSIYTPAGFRARVAQLLAWGGTTDPSTPTPPEPPVTDAMLDAIDTTKPFAGRATADGEGMKKGEVWIISPVGRYKVERPTLDLLYFTKRIHVDKNGQPNPLDPKHVASIPIIK